ncbi:hypothetical protein [Albidovulum sp.]|uniref:hypothetical protein n=1 Tax=Albidovulum sp. TaxID=1872424 RepID=UPI001DFB3B66|nr:hypothetical protein [Paracoccaceae bacterium]MCB2143240.1 hypothetical protein [Paracoccaceae bacterium]MCO5127376.1 hypothetical protein [Paracoccaceae bacterium]HPE26388.1 hypothetical protein [Albidovulum sp.]
MAKSPKTDERKLEMKRILLAATALSIAAGAASAMNNPTELSNVDRSEIKRLVPNADLSNLTVAQVQALQSVIYSEENAKGGQIRAILN